MTPTAPPARRPEHPLTSSTASHTWAAVLAVLVAIVCYLALTPKPPASLNLGWDKLNHLAAFTALSFSACLCTPAAPLQRKRLLLGLLLLGGLIEILQRFVPGRSAEWADLLADAIGITCGTLMASAMLWLATRTAVR